VSQLPEKPSLIACDVLCSQCRNQFARRVKRLVPKMPFDCPVCGHRNRLASPETSALLLAALEASRKAGKESQDN
jgi:transcription elongation factor Elf1